ncbi:hypothetical protein QZH41_005694 [Actinostola sp. cb2023]|nr:hypothetical protein QZH41_005694 [Actinostola sp. cb2023]
MVRFPAPKTHYAQDIVFEKDSPIFCTANEHFSFVRGGAVDRVETQMMRHGSKANRAGISDDCSLGVEIKISKGLGIRKSLFQFMKRVFLFICPHKRYWMTFSDNSTICLSHIDTESNFIILLWHDYHW